MRMIKESGCGQRLDTVSLAIATGKHGQKVEHHTTSRIMAVERTSMNQRL